MELQELKNISNQAYKKYEDALMEYKNALIIARKTVKISNKGRAKIYTRGDGYAIYVPNCKNIHGERNVFEYIDGKKGEVIIESCRLRGYEFKDWLLTR